MLPFIMKVRELIKLLENNGWEFIRQSSSHKIYKHPEKTETLSLPDHPGDIPNGTRDQLLKKAGLKRGKKK